ncbi:GBS Bsp-like repeat-containing protein [Paenibacillus sp. FSL H8-0048]|uniref:GBS Bsp-like repeat-containing protein n=1 Tax=Paenibacillus sp. FSL H8-0048 TaxID=2954508 RepID=UPI0030F5D463
MGELKLLRKIYTCFSLCFLSIVQSEYVMAADEAVSEYILVDSGEAIQKQQINIYNKGRLETEILPNNSLVSYSYDSNGNVLKKYTTHSTEPYTISSSAASYDIYLKGVPENLEQVIFPSWTELYGQDDIEWINGEKIAPGVWKATIVLSRHGGLTGIYNTHIYADGTLLKMLTVQVQNTAKVTSPKTTSLADGSYEISVEGVARNISEVRFPTWTENKGQDDLENPWILGEKLNDTTWKIRVPFSKHNFETGNYFTDIYFYDKYNNSSGLNGPTVIVQGGTGGSSETDITGVSYDVYIYGLDPQTQKVQFPTWTANKDQDDLEWIEGVKVANGVWKGTVIYSNHNSELGRYITHVYADGKYSGAWEFNVVDTIKYTYSNIAYLSSGFYDITVNGIPSNVATVRFPTWTEKNGHDDIEEPWIEGERLSSTSWRIRIPYYKHNNEIGAYSTHVYSYDAYGNSRIIGMLSVDVRN